jgi:hypothetical protein
MVIGTTQIWGMGREKAKAAVRTPNFLRAALGDFSPPLPSRGSHLLHLITA